MASLDGFDARTVEASEPMGPIPAGTYTAMMIESDKKTNKAGTGQYLFVKFQIQSGEYAGRKVSAFLNLWNANETAKEIAFRDMAAICQAVGVMQPNDSQDLHNIPLDIVVGVRDPDEQGRVFNDIKGYQKRVAQPAAPVSENANKPAWA